MSTLMTQAKSDIDRLWTEFWTGGITNPLTVIEQISFLMFARLLDVAEARNEKRFERTKKHFKRHFSEDQQHLRWRNFKHLPSAELHRVVSEQVFRHFRSLNGGSTFAEFMREAQFMIQKPSLLLSAVNIIDRLPITEGDGKGDLYEHLLGKLTTAGINGQFRTPRHIIRFMVELLEPKPSHVIGDPACGTAGFLVSAMQYLLENNTSEEGHLIDEEGAIIYTGDGLEPYRDHIQNRMFHGFDFDTTMLRVASMNLMLHGVENPQIYWQDTLARTFPEKFPEHADGAFDIILANPPFKGSLDASSVHASLTNKVRTKKTELLFLVLMLRMLKLGGRCAVVVPDGVLFGSSKAHVALRRLLIEEHQLEGVFSLPSGVFKPYAGVSTAIVVFTKGGRTEDVFFYDVQADGFSLDDKRTPVSEDGGPMGPKGANDLYDALERWNARKLKRDTDRAARAFTVPRAEIEEASFDLSLNRYKRVPVEAVAFDPPKEVLARLRDLEAEISADLTALGRLL